MFHRVQSVHPLPDLMLDVLFCSGDRKRYDVRPLLSKWEAFQALSLIPALFEQVRVDDGGYGVIWNDELDLSCDELWDGGIQFS